MLAVELARVGSIGTASYPTAEGLEAVMPLDDHPWGDRGFAVVDPLGITLYLYSEREPSEEFKQYYK